MVKNINKIYKENYRHKHTLKYIREVVEKCIDPKFKFAVDDIYKTFIMDGTWGRLNDDFSLSDGDKKDLDEVDCKVLLSYTVHIKREDFLFMDCGLDDYIYLIECLKKADIKFAKVGLKISPNTIDSEMDFDVVEVDSSFKLLKDNSNISDFLHEIRYDYSPLEGRSYNLQVDDNAFYRVYLVNGWNAKSESHNIENLEHFSNFLESKCKKHGFKMIETTNFKFNIYTKRQYRMLTIKEVL